MRPASQFFVYVISAALVVLGAASPSIAQEEGEAVTDEQVFYAMGVAMSESVKGLQPSEAEIASALKGFEEGLKGKSDLDPQQFRSQFRDLQQERMKLAAAEETNAAAAFLVKMEKEKGATKTESGLIYTVVAEGTGNRPQSTDKVKVHYHGTLRDGTVFDSSVDRGEPMEFPLDRVIPCWTEGVGLMKPGGKAKLVCPSAIAYGDRPAGKIPPGSALVFDVELIEVLGE